MNSLKFMLLVLIIAISGSNYSQQDSTKKYGWLPGAVVGFNISQIALSNWTQGGDNSISWSFLGTGSIDYISDDWNFKNSLKINYGKTKLGSADFRTSENEFFFQTVLSKYIGWALDPFISNTVKTAISAGYDYKTTPITKIADFWDPGYLTQSLGFIYNKSEAISTRLGIAFQETFTNKFQNYSADKNGNLKKFRFDTGIESVTEGHFNIYTNMMLKSSLRLFSRFESMDVWDVRWDNVIVSKINDLFNVSLAWLVVYEKQQSPKTQLKEGLQLGVAYVLY
ncbi:MAG: DUF3078 domain-containing protein [Bacteroidota bacterium]|nr:DUF3078 domain-containing protein [Bacteroidota bacterium]